MVNTTHWQGCPTLWCWDMWLLICKCIEDIRHYPGKHVACRLETPPGNTQQEGSVCESLSGNLLRQESPQRATRWRAGQMGSFPLTQASTPSAASLWPAARRVCQWANGMFIWWPASILLEGVTTRIAEQITNCACVCIFCARSWFWNTLWPA